MYVKLDSRFSAAPMLGRGYSRTSVGAKTALRIVLLGPPGCGKGTQASRMCSRFKLSHVSTGDILRRNIDGATEIGLQAKQSMEAGELVSDALIEGMLRELYTRKNGDQISFVLDGFPRSEDQARALSGFFAGRGQAVHKVLMLELPDDEVVGRLTHRRTCCKCGRSYHLTACPPKQDGVCDFDGEPLSWRADDREDVIRHRLETYHRQTEPVAAFYEKMGVLARIDASAAVETVESRISSILAELL